MIEKEKCIKGLKLVVNKKVIKSNNDCFWGNNQNGLFAYNRSVPLFSEGYRSEIPVGTVIEIVSAPKGSGASVFFKTDGGLFESWWSNFRNKVDVLEGADQPEMPDLSGNKRYKIFYEGKPYKPKYFNDMGKVKSSLLIAFGYYENQYHTFEKYKDRNPELQDNQIPEWFSYGNNLNRSDCEKFEIMSYTGGSKTPVKEDFNVLEYYDQSMKLIDVTAQFGSAARELFKNTMQTKEFSYMIVYSPDEYRDPKIFNSYGYVNFDFSELKESQKIKDVVKASGLKNIKKCTKFGKTAIVFKNLDDLKQIMLRLDPKEYFILDCDGDQMVEKNTRFIKLIMIQKAADEQENN